MKAGNGPAHDADEDEREDRAVEVRPAACCEMLVDGRCLQLGVRHDHARDQEPNGADLEKA